MARGFRCSIISTPGQILGAGAAGQPLYPKFGRTQDTNLHFVGVSTHYNGLQTKLDRRFSNGFQMTTAYTFGKSLGWQTDTGTPDYYIDMRRNYARLSYDRTHTFVQSYVYELPFGKGKAIRDRAVRAPGCSVDGRSRASLTLMSGTPLNFTTSNGALNAPSNKNSPNLVAPVKILHGINTDFWFDPASFAVPAPRTFGNLGRYTTDGPGFFQLDTSLFRRFRIKERFTLEFRAEAFAVTNTAEFANPNQNLGDANFGRVTATLGVGDAGSAGGNRSLQFGAKLMF